MIKGMYTGNQKRLKKPIKVTTSAAVFKARYFARPRATAIYTKLVRFWAKRNGQIIFFTENFQIISPPTVAPTIEKGNPTPPESQP